MRLVIATAFLVVAVAGCIGGDPSGHAVADEAGAGAGSTNPISADGERASAGGNLSRGAATDTIVLAGCVGVDVTGRLADSISPWPAPTGWEREVPGRIHYTIWGLHCQEVDLWGLDVAHNVSFYWDAHNNLDPRDSGPSTTYDDLRWLLSSYSSNSEVAAWMARVAGPTGAVVVDANPSAREVTATTSDGGLEVSMEAVSDGDPNYTNFRLIFVVGLEPLTYFIVEEAAVSEEVGLVASVAPSPGLEAAKWPLADSEAGAHMTGILHAASTYTITKVVETQ